MRCFPAGLTCLINHSKFLTWFYILMAADLWRMEGYAVVSDLKVVEAEVLPQGWSAQRAELWALIRALELSQDQRVNIYTDSRYAFATLHVHGAYIKKEGSSLLKEKELKTRLKS